MATTTFYTDNTSNTFADALQAVGLAEVLSSWLTCLGRPSTPIRISDCGSHYRIELPSPLGEEDAAAVKYQFTCGRGKRLVTAKHRKKALEAGEPEPLGYPYDEEKTKRDVYVAWMKKLSPADRQRFNDNPKADEVADKTPDEDLGLYVAINHFKIADTYNKLLDRWGNKPLDDYRVNLSLLLQTYASHPNNIPAKPETETALQIINPASGKGSNAAKATGLSIGGIDSFWLSEYLKFVGYFTIAAPLLVRESKDRKAYVLHPVQVELSALRQVMRSFRASFYRATAIKLDILAVLRFTHTLVEHIAAEKRTASALNYFGSRPRVTDIAQGFDVAFYKDMGSAYATMNLATINLPGWLAPITTTQDAEAIQEALAEHIQVIFSTKSAKGDEGSEEIELLRRYRDFLSGHDVERFFDFAARYGDYLLAKRHRNQWAGQLSVRGMEMLVNQSSSRKKFLPIVNAPGFQAIATALRHATVLAQYRSARDRGFPYEVRYGLGQELLRAATYPDDFLKSLGAFIQSYNAENARIDERIAKNLLANTGRNRRASIRTEHMDDIVRLIDEYGDSELICKMLVGYGYARDPHTQPDDKPAPSDLDVTETDDESDD